MSILQVYKSRTWFLDLHIHSRPKHLGKGGKTIFPESLGFSTNLLKSRNVANITEQNTLALLCTRYLFAAKTSI